MQQFFYIYYAMKHSIYLLLACQLIIGHLTAKDTPKGTVTLKGKITNRLSDSINVKYLYEPDITYPYKKYYSKLDAQGNFSITFPVAMPYTSVTIEHGDQGTDMIVEPGYDLVMQDNAQNFDSSLVFSGKGAAIQNLLAHHSLTYEPMDAYQQEVNKIYIQEPAEFEKSVQDAAQKQLNYLEQNKTGLPPSFAMYWKTFYQYQNYYSMLVYPTFHEMKKRKSYSINIDSITKDEYTVVQHVPEKFNDEWLMMPIYHVYINTFYDAQVHAWGKAHFTKDTTEQLTAISIKQAYAHMPPKSAEFNTAHHVETYSKYLSLAEVEQEVKDFKTHFPKSAYTAEVESKLNLKKKMSPGMPAIDFVINTSGGKKMKLSDLKGKVVYVDFWASWCVPCAKEMPPAKLLREHFKDKNVAFVYVSIDEQDEAWKKGMEKHELADAINTRVPGGFQAEELKQYGISGIPAYFIVDKNGNFATDEQIRPSAGDKLVKMIDKLLE